MSTVGLVPGLQGPVQRVLSCACKLHHVLCFLLCQILGVRFYVEILDPFGTESCEEGGRTDLFSLLYNQFDGLFVEDAVFSPVCGSGLTTLVWL